MDTNHFLALARVSSREQEREGFSLDIQEDALKREAERRHGKIIKLWRIAETASKKDERTTFKELVAFATKHADELDGILFYKIDRAARNLFDYVELERLESEYHVPFFSVTQPTENTPAGRMQRRMLASMASYYTEQQSLDVREGVKRRVECGLFPQKAAYGYRNIRVDKRGLVEVHPVNSPKVRKVFAHFAAERLTLEELRQRLHDDGVFYSDSRPFFPTTTLYAILRSRAYLGEIRYHQRWLPGTHEPLVDQATWDRVQRSLCGKVYQTHDLTFAGALIRCKHCGHVVTGERTVKKSTGKPYFYYRCSVYNAPGHPRVRVSEKFLNQSFLSIFDRLKIEDGEQRAWFLRQVRRQTAQRVESGSKRATENTRQLSLTIQRRKELLDMRLSGEVGADVFAVKDAELRKREDQLREALTGEPRGVASEPLAFDLAKCLRATWAYAELPAKRRILRSVSSDLQLDGELVPTLAKPFDVMDGTVVREAGQRPLPQDEDRPVPFGSPPWVTATELSDTIRAWQPSYGMPLTPDEALGILLNVDALLEVLLSKRESSSEGTPE
jgi:DNA invertase Pin-like site-specific DNA recombinase